MSASVEWYTTTSRTYEIERYDESLDTWASITTGETSSPYSDSSGTVSTFYRVRDDTDGPGNESPWTPQFLGIAENPATCIITGYIYKEDGAPLNNSLVYFKPLTDQKVQSLRFSVLNQIETYTDINGYFSQAIVRGIDTYVKIPDRAFQELITVPDQATVNIDDLV